MFSLSSLQKGDVYAGIGSRETPPEIQTVMTDIARHLKGRGVILRSGGAGGADISAMRGIEKICKQRQLITLQIV